MRALRDNAARRSAWQARGGPPTRARARARQVNIAGRAAAISPGSADTLAAFAGVYASFQLPDVPGKPADAGFELSITVNAQGARPGPGAVRVHGPAAALARRLLRGRPSRGMRPNVVLRAWTAHLCQFRRARTPVLGSRRPGDVGLAR